MTDRQPIPDDDGLAALARIAHLRLDKAKHETDAPLAVTFNFADEYGARIAIHEKGKPSADTRTWKYEATQAELDSMDHPR